MVRRLLNFPTSRQQQQLELEQPGRKLEHPVQEAVRLVAIRHLHGP